MRIMWLLGCVITLMMANVQGQPSDLPFPVPREANGWQWNGKSDTYDSQTIFDYIDGIGEIYRAYNMRRVWACRYEKADSPTLTLDIFDMGTAEDAFGIFSFERDGEDAGIGQGSDYAGRMLRFWKDRYFVVITAQEESNEVRNAILQLGRQLAAAIPRTGKPPELLQFLPAEGLQRERILFFRHPMIMNRHFFVAEKDILNLSPKTEGVLATYLSGKAQVRLMLVRYPAEADAVRARDTFSQAYLREGRQKGAVQTENKKWTAARRQGRTVAIVFDAPSQKQAQQMLQSIRLPEKEVSR
ncbi:MAG: hypothetical protein K6U75_00475 [Firmicutes bacterium]|nr:hypothetical protein [Bacillota bacterium]